MRCGLLALVCVVAFLLAGAGGIVPRSGRVGGCSWLVLGRCGAVLRGPSVVPLVFCSMWAARDRCGEGPGVSWGGVCVIGVSQPGGVWSRGAWGCRPSVEWAQGCKGCCLWARRGLPGLWGPRAGGSRHFWRVVAPVWRPWLVSGCMWQGCIVSMVGGGLWARAWGGSLVGHRLAAGAGASLWVGLPWCPLGASRRGPWSAGCGSFWGVPHPWGYHCVLAGRTGGCVGLWG